MSFRNIVHHGHAIFFYGHAGDVGPERVYRKQGVRQFATDDGEGILQPFHLLSLVGHLCARPRRTGSHVDDVAALFHDFHGTPGDVGLRLLPASVVK